jgi:hypothetical protein
VSSSLRAAGVALAGLLILACPGFGQVQFGDFSTNLNGTISAGYTDNFGNLSSSDHSWTVGGAGTYSGYYYNPNFVSFSATPYLNQSSANSDFQSISDASGVNFTSSIFGGSHFPGSISYAKAYNSEGNYGIPGISSFSTHGDSNTLGINWSEMLPDAPSLSVGFQDGGNQYSVYGTNDQGNSNSRSFNLHSGYTLLGFNLGAFYSTGVGNSFIPQITTLEPATETHSDSTAYGFNLGHLLPLHGGFSASINRSDVNSDFLGDSYSANIDTYDTAVSFQPTDKLHVSGTADYSDNLAGQLLQSLVTSGAVVPGLNTSQQSHAMDFMGTLSYSFFPNLQTSVFGERRTQYFLGENYGSNSYGGGATYGHGLFGGTFNVAGTVTENTSDTIAAKALGFSASTNYSRRIFGWAVSGSFSYAQNAQTLLITYMTSLYSYSGNVRRRFGQLTFTAGAGAGRTGLTAQPGTQNTSLSYNAGLGYGRWITATGTYSKSDGNALLTSGGLVPVPVPSPILPASDLILYGGHSYSVSLTSTPAKRLTLAAAFAKANSNTFDSSLASWNNNEAFNALIQYQFRKMYFTTGFARLDQGFSLSGTPPQMVSSFYVGVSRWFNFF